MSASFWAGVVDAFDLRRAPIPTRVELIQRYNGARLRVTIVVTPRDDPSARPVEVAEESEAPTYIRERSAATSYLRGLVQRIWLHELDESILVDGVRIFDPHKAGA